MNKKIVLLFFIYFSIQKVSAQLNIALNQIFKPNIRLRYQFLPTQPWADSTRLGYQQASLAGIIPLGGSAEVKLKQLKVQANQTFLNIAIGGRQVEINHLKEDTKLKNATVGITHVRARVGKGIWVYSAQAGVLANNDITDRKSIFGLAAVAKIQVKGLRKQNIYGVAVAFSPRSIIPVPILGWNRKLAKRWDMAILLPVQANLSYRVGKKTTLEWQNTFSSMAFPIDGTEIRYSVPTIQWAQYIDIRSSIELTQKINKSWQFVAEAGITPYRQLQWNNQDRKTVQTFSGFATSGFASLGIRFSLPQGLLSSQMFEAE